MGDTVDQLDEILQFLTLDERESLKMSAQSVILGLTGTKEGRALVLTKPALLVCLENLICDRTSDVAKKSCFAFVNLCAEEDSCVTVLRSVSDSFIKVIVSKIVDPESEIADPSSMLLMNLSRWNSCCEKVLTALEDGDSLDRLVLAFTANNYHKKGAKLHYLGPLFSNFSQMPRFQKFLTDRERKVIQRLMPFTGYEASAVRRGGVVGVLRNCCFNTENHEWLLSDEVDLLSSLLLPLAGPEEFSEDEMEKLPLDLQYLPETKTREEDPDIRKMLLEALTKLCATKPCREFVRNKNTYLILRELHKWEKDSAALLACENLVDLLIRTEEEIGDQGTDLTKVDVPADLAEKFFQEDEALLKQDIS